MRKNKLWRVSYINKINHKISYLQDPDLHVINLSKIRFQATAFCKHREMESGCAEIDPDPQHCYSNAIHLVLGQQVPLEILCVQLHLFNPAFNYIPDLCTVLKVIVYTCTDYCVHLYILLCTLVQIVYTSRAYCTLVQNIVKTCIDYCVHLYRLLCTLVQIIVNT